MNTDASSEDLYTGELIDLLELVWGEGWLSPGGPDEVRRLIGDADLAGKSLLDLGCGTGGIDVFLAEKYHAGPITGIDVEATVLEMARQRIRERGLEDRIGFVRVEPGPLPFPDESFDVVFSKAAIVHIPDKEGLMADFFRLLEPGGWLLVADWLISHDDEPSPEMKAYTAAEGLKFAMASPNRYRHALEQAGFTGIELKSRNAWYREVAKRELRALKGDFYKQGVSRLGKDFVDHNIDIWEKMIVVLETGEHCPHHFRARKPDNR